MTQTSLTPVSPGAIDVLLGIKHVGPSPTPAPAEPEHDLADAPNLGSVATAPVDPTSVLASGFVRPVEGPITSRFGPRFHPILQVWKLHTGTDIGAACGTPVKAAKDGSVTSAGVAGGYGNRVVLDHGQGLATTYNHLSSYAAAVGMQVRQGQVIGYVGTTGLSTGCHLHFEVMVNGVLVDSGPYLDLAPAPSVTLPPAVAATSGAAAPVAAAAAPAPAPAVQAPAVQAPAVPPAPAPAPPPPAAAPPAPPSSPRRRPDPDHADPDHADDVMPAARWHPVAHPRLRRVVPVAGGSLLVYRAEVEQVSVDVEHIVDLQHRLDLQHVGIGSGEQVNGLETHQRSVSHLPRSHPSRVAMASPTWVVERAASPRAARSALTAASTA